MKHRNYIGRPLLEESDADGNKLIVDNGGSIILKLRNGKKNNIGKLSKVNNRTCYFKEEKESDTFRKNNSWSVNYELLKYIDGTINYRTEKGIYRIEKDRALEIGSFLWFQKSNVERKFYIPKDYWKFEPLIINNQKDGK
jgi:hypothetical protein